MDPTRDAPACEGVREVNTVVYDPQVITPAAMIDALKRAGTYRGRAEGG